MKSGICRIRWDRRRCLFPFPKRPLPFLAVDDTISNQAFSHERCNIFPQFSYKKAKNAFSNSVRKNDVGAQVEFSLKFTKGLGSPVIDVILKKGSLLVYLPTFFGILAGSVW